MHVLGSVPEELPHQKKSKIRIAKLKPIRYFLPFIVTSKLNNSTIILELQIFAVGTSALCAAVSLS